MDAPCAAALGLAVVVGTVVVAVVALLSSGERKRKIREFLQQRAGPLGGSVTDEGWHPTLRWHEDRVFAELSFHFGAKNVPPHTQALFQWAPAGRLRITPEGFFTGLRKFFGAQDIEIQDAAFDQRFLIQGGPEAWVVPTLGPSVRASIMRLTDLGGGVIRLEAGPSGVIIHVGRCLALTPAFDDFLHLSRSVFYEVRGHEQFGTEVRVITASEVAAEGRCPVCGSAMDADVRRCSACRTPHHEDCWDYFGGCAIFGCASRKGTKVHGPVRIG